MFILRFEHIFVLNNDGGLVHRMRYGALFSGEGVGGGGVKSKEKLCYVISL